jgi:hypothetical protein
MNWCFMHDCHSIVDSSHERLMGTPDCWAPVNLLAYGLKFSDQCL